MNLTEIVKTDWDNILKQVDKKEIPIELLEKVVVNFIDNSTITIDIQSLLESGNDPTDIEDLLNERLEEMNDLIKDVDFHILRDRVVDIISPYTNNILKKFD